MRLCPVTGASICPLAIRLNIQLVQLSILGPLQNDNMNAILASSIWNISLLASIYKLQSLMKVVTLSLLLSNNAGSAIFGPLCGLHPNTPGYGAKPPPAA